MADFNSKYSGEQVEALLDIVAEGISGGGGEGEVQKTTEAEITAMGFTKNEGTITEVKMNGESKGSNGIVDLGTVITEHQDISGKQDEITDLDDIRRGAGKGDTSVQGVKLNGSTIIRKDKNGIVDLDTIEGGGGNVSFINNDALQGLPFGYVGGYYRSYEFDGTASGEVNLGYIDNYYYDTIAIAYDDRLFEGRISSLKGDGKLLGTVVVRVDDSYNLYAGQVAPKKATFGWRIYTDKTLMPDSWVDLANYYTKSEVDSAIATAITTTLNTPV
jgi:hypothetical protein